MAIHVDYIVCKAGRIYVETFFRLANVNITLPKASEMTGWEKDGITNKQKNYLHVLGLGNTGVMYKKHAMVAIKLAEERAKNGLATPQEMYNMHAYGIKDVHKRTSKEAQYILRNRWKKDFDPDSYPGLEFTFMIDNKEEKVYSRKAANIKFQELKATGKPILVKMTEK